MMQEEQQQLQPVPGGSTCDKCTAATRNYNHDNRIFAPYIFSRFKGGVTRRRHDPAEKE